MKFNPKWIIGKTVASVEMNIVRNGSSGGRTWTNPVIHFTDGSLICFSTIEGRDPGNEYGTSIGYYKRKERKR